MRGVRNAEGRECRWSRWKVDCVYTADAHSTPLPRHAPSDDSRGYVCRWVRVRVRVRVGMECVVWLWVCGRGCVEHGMGVCAAVLSSSFLQITAIIPRFFEVVLK